VLVPLACTGSVLALILAAGTTSGVGIVILVPLVWTALFHRPWESACIVVAIVAVEVIISLTPAVAPDVVLARRIVLIIQQVFATGLSLQGTTALIADREARHRVAEAVDDLDHVIQVLRDAIFGLQQRMRGRGLRAEVEHLAAQFSPPPAITFSGPVDGALEPAARACLLDTLRDGFGQTWPVSRVRGRSG
jgi:hypothetical protein